jgi:hypothetical protein
VETRQTRRTRGRVGIRRVKRTVKHVDPFSILKISLFFYAIFFVLWLVFVALLYYFVDGAGLFEIVDEVQAGFEVKQKLNFSLWSIERWAFLIGLTFVVVGSILNVFVAFLYNVAADILGGIEMTFVEKDA